MADRFPIILNTSANQLQEIASGDTLDVSGAAVKANLVDSLSVVGTGVSVAGIVTATSFVGSGANLSGINISAVKDSGGNVKIQAEASGAIYTGIHTFGSTTSFTNGVFNGTVTSTGAVVNGDSDLNGDIDVEGDLDVDGHTNLDNVSIAGVTTFTGNADFSSRIQITSTTPYIDFIDNNNNPDYRLVNANGTFGIYDIGSNLYRMLINTNGHIDFKTNVDCEAGLDVTGNATVSGDIDVDGHTNLDNVSVAGFTTITQDLNVDGHTNLDNVSIAGVTTFSGAITGTSANLSGNITANRFTGTDGNAITLGDSKKIVLGTGSDLQIFHDGTNSRIENDATNLFIQSNLINLTNAAGTEVLINANANGDVKLYYNGSSKLATTNTGINVTGNVVGDGLTVDGDSDLNGDLDVDGHTNLDNVSVAGVTTFASGINCSTDGVGNGINIGAGSDLILQHNGTNSFIDNNTGDLYIQTTGSGDDILLESADDIVLNVNGSNYGIYVAGGAQTELYWNAAKRLATSNLGVDIFGGSNYGNLWIYTDDGNKRGGIYADNSELCGLVDDQNHFLAFGAKNGAFYLRYDQSTKLETTTTGVTITGTAVAGALDISGDIDVDGHTNLDNLSVAGVTTFTGAINGSSAAFSGNATITGNLSVGGVLTYEDVKNVDSVGIATARVGLKVLAGGANVVGVVTASNGIFVPDNQAIHLGNVSGGGDLQLTHNGSHSYIKDSGTGSLFIQGSQVALQSTSGENMVTAVADGAVQLMYDHSTKLATTNTGVSITGNIAVSGTVDGVDIASFKTSFDNLSTDLVNDTSPQLGGALDLNGQIISVGDGGPNTNQEHIRFGNDGDLRIYHDGSHSYINDTGTGRLILLTSYLNVLNAANNENIIEGVQDGAVNLYYNGSKKFETRTDGVEVTGVVVNDGIRTGDLEYIMAGNSGDIAIYHDSNGSINGTAGSSYIKCQGVHDNILNIFTSSTTGKINLKSNNNAETMLSATGNGAVELYYDNGKKLETTSSGITVTGNATATTFIGALTGTASGNPTLTNGSNDRIVTASGANALNGESNLTYNGNNLQFNTTANGHAVILKSTGNYYTKLQFDSNRSAANDVLTIIDFKWDGDTVADILAVAGSDSSNKDDGQLKFRTSPAQGSITERVRIEQNGQIGIGGISPRTINSHAPQVQISGNNYSNATVSIINNANDSAGAYLFLSKQRSGSAGGSTIIQSNDIIGQIRFSGADGTDLENPMAYIECRADGTPGSNDVPGRLVFYTTPDGSGSPQVRMTIKNNGRVGINESDPSEMLYVAGNIYATGNVTAYSDIRVKENVKEISNALEAVDKIRGVSYTRKDTKEDTLGVSAQEVETMFPELVVEDNHGMKSVNYNGLVGVLFSAVKELSTKLKEIENK